MFGVYIGSGHVSLIRCHYIFFIYFANILNSFQKSTTRRSLQCPEREGTTAPYKRYPRWLLVLCDSAAAAAWTLHLSRLLTPSSHLPPDPFISAASWPLHPSQRPMSAPFSFYAPSSTSHMLKYGRQPPLRQGVEDFPTLVDRTMQLR